MILLSQQKNLVSQESYYDQWASKLLRTDDLYIHIITINHRVELSSWQVSLHNQKLCLGVKEMKAKSLKKS